MRIRLIEQSAVKIVITTLFCTVIFIGSGCSISDYDKGFDAAEKKDYISAFKLWLPLAEQGEARAQSKIATMYQLGYGVRKDIEKAVYWHTKACEQGNRLSEFLLGELYDNGHGVPQDHDKAVELITKSAAQGLRQAIDYLNSIHHNDEEIVNFIDDV